MLAVQAYMRVKLLTGLRRGDLLRVQPGRLRDEEIHVRAAQDGEDDAASASSSSGPLSYARPSSMALAARPVDIAPFLFCTRRGECYVKEDGTANGWDSMRQRFMGRVLTETKVQERFTEHDLRAKCASDAGSLEHARQLLAHADGRLTERVYRRRPERVKPLR